MVTPVWRRHGEAAGGGAVGEGGTPPPPPPGCLGVAGRGRLARIPVAGGMASQQGAAAPGPAALQHPRPALTPTAPGVGELRGVGGGRWAGAGCWEAALGATCAGG